MIKLGDKVVDKISGLVGTAVSKVDYINGCTQFGVQPRLKKGSTDIVTYNIDIEQLELADKKKAKIKKSKTGGATRLRDIRGQRSKGSSSRI